MRRAAAILVMALAAQIVGDTRAAAEDPPPAAKEYASADGRFTISMPTSWAVSRDRHDVTVMSWFAKLPDDGGDVSLEVYNVAGILNVRAQPYLERGVHPERYGVPGPARVEMEPVPHVWMDVPDKGDVARHAWFYRVVRRNGLTLHTVCDAKRWDALRTDFLCAAQSLGTTLPEWPPVPGTYRRLSRDGYIEYLHPSVKDADADAVHRLLRTQEAEFTKRYGPLWKPPDSPFVVVIHARRPDAEAMDQYAAGADHGNWASFVKRQLFVVPPPKGDNSAMAEFVREAWSAFFAQSFAGSIPLWVSDGESWAAYSEAATGKSLPSVMQGLFDSMNDGLRRLDELVALAPSGGATRDQLLAYLAFFRFGPKTYRDAFAAFLKDVAATGDCETAQKTRLLSLDQAKLRAAAESFVAREMKPVKSK